MGLAQVLFLGIVFVRLYDEMRTLFYLCISTQIPFWFTTLVFQISSLFLLVWILLFHLHSHIHGTTAICFANCSLSLGNTLRLEHGGWGRCLISSDRTTSSTLRTTRWQTYASKYSNPRRALRWPASASPYDQYLFLNHKGIRPSAPSAKTPSV